MRRKQFTQLISSLRAELARNNDPGVRAADLPQLQQTINRVYEDLYRSFDWPFMRQVFTRVPMVAGERYYDFPDTLDFDRIEKVVVWWNEQPEPIDRGIDFEHYADYDSDNGDRLDPVMRWDVRWQSTKEVMEVWPIPASADAAIQFTGITKFVRLVDDADLCMLDDNMVVLRAAIELDPDDNRRAAKVNSFNEQFLGIKGRTKAEIPIYRLGLGSADAVPVGRTVVRIAGR